MVIVYQSKTGFTKQYAEMLGASEHVEVLPLKEAEQKLSSGTPGSVPGPLSAGRIVGLERARKAFLLRGVCGVGMSLPSPELPESCARAISWGTCLSSISRAAGPPDRVNPMTRANGQSGDPLHPKGTPGQGGGPNAPGGGHAGYAAPRGQLCLPGQPARPPELVVQAVIFP